jgi:acetyltransferase-like isoleucine patch superfamily enzyme
VLTREDANSESVLLAEWLVDDRASVAKGRPVCVVETSKASVEIEAPGEGTIVQLVPAGTEVEPGTCIALVAADAGELERAQTRRPVEPLPETAALPRNVTRRAAWLAERHGIDLARIAKAGFITAEDVEALIESPVPELGEPDHVLAGISTHDVTLPALFGLEESEGALDPGFLDSLRADPAAFGRLSSEEKCAQYRRYGARVGEGVVLGEGAVIVAPRIVLGDGLEIGARSSVACAEVFAAGELTRFASRLRLACRRAYLGSGIWAGEGIVVGGGGHRDPWATFVVGDNAFLGDEAFVNVCRPVLIGAETFVTMRSVILTHNIGHSVLEGFENRFAGVVVEDRAQIGVGAVIYAGCRIGREAIVASNSYALGEVPAGAFAIGVPARVSGAASRAVNRPRQAALALRMVDELRELLALRGVEVSPPANEEFEGLELTGPDGPGRVLFVERLTTRDVPAGAGETVVLTLELAGDPPDGCAVLDLLARRVHGDGGVVLDSVREFCRKRGIRFSPGPWRYRGGLV